MNNNKIELNRRRRFHTFHTYTVKCMYIVYEESNIMGEKHWKNIYICLRLFIDVWLFIMHISFSSCSVAVPREKKVYKFKPFRTWKWNVENSVTNTNFTLPNGNSNFIEHNLPDVWTNIRIYMYTTAIRTKTTSSNLYMLLLLFRILSSLLYAGCLYVSPV